MGSLADCLAKAKGFLSQADIDEITSAYQARLRTGGFTRERAASDAVEVLLGKARTELASLKDPIAGRIAKLKERAGNISTLEGWTAAHEANPDQAYSTIDDAVSESRAIEKELAKKYGVKVADLEDAPLTDDERNFLYYDELPDMEKASELRRVVEPVSSLEDAATEIGYALKDIPTAAKMDSRGERAMSRLNYLHREIMRLGGDPMATLKDAVIKYATRTADPDDQEFMARNILERLSSLGLKTEEQPLIEPTPAGKQSVLPGAERASDAKLAQMKADAPLKPKKAQNLSMDDGLFGDSKDQRTMFAKGWDSVEPGANGTRHVTPEAVEQFISEQGPRLQAFARHILGHDIEINMVREIKGYPKAAGMHRQYSGDVWIAALPILKYPESWTAVGVMGHELIHYMRGAGIFTRGEWGALNRYAEKLAPKYETLRKHYRDIYEKANRDAPPIFKQEDFEINSRILEEIVAKEFEKYVNGTPPHDPAVSRIFQKIKDFIERIQNFMEGNGFRIADDVYRDLLAGNMAGRKKGKPNFHYASEDYASEPESNPDEGRKITESNLNLDYLNSPETIKDMLGAISEYNNHFSTQRRGVVTNEQTRALAEDMGISEKELLAMPTGGALNAHDIFAARTLLVASAKRLYTLAQDALKGQNDFKALAKFQQAWVRHVAIQEHVAGITAEAGRALQQFKMLAGDVDWKEAKGIVDAAQVTGAKDTQGVDAIMGLAQMISTLQNTGQVSKLTREAYKATFKDMIREAWINALLSGIRTQVVNALGNQIVALWQFPEHAVASVIGPVLSTFQRGDNERVLARELSVRAAGMLEGYGEGIRAAAIAFSDEESVFDGDSQWIEKSRRKAIPGMLGRVIRIPTRAMGAMDEMFKAVNFHAELKVLAFRQAVLKEGLKGDAIRTRVDEIMAAPSKEIIDKARSYAEYQTFTNSLGEKGRGWMRLRETSHLWWLVPFMKTPINLFKYATARTPLGLFMSEVRDDLMGKNGNVRRDLAAARMLVGTGIMVMVGSALAAGMLSGGGPADKREKDLMYADGWRPYSVKIKGKWVSYQRLDPFSMIVGITADAIESYNQIIAASEDPEKFGKLPGMVLGSIIHVLLDKTWFTGPSDFLKGMDTTDGSGFTYWLQGMAASAVPTLMAHWAQTQDPVLREARTWVDRFKSRVPYRTQTLEPQRNVLGDIKEREQVHPTGIGAVDFAVNLVNPFYMTTAKNDPVVKALLDSGYAPSMPSRKINGYTLPDKLYGEYSELAGKRAKKNMERMLSRWPSMDKDRQEKEARKAFDEAREWARREMKSRYDYLRRSKAKADAMAE